MPFLYTDAILSEENGKLKWVVQTSVALRSSGSSRLQSFGFQYATKNEDASILCHTWSIIKESSISISMVCKLSRLWLSFSRTPSWILMSKTFCLFRSLPPKNENNFINTVDKNRCVLYLCSGILKASATVVHFARGQFARIFVYLREKLPKF